MRRFWVDESELELRGCEDILCSGSFRVMKMSGQRYCSKFCEFRNRKNKGFGHSENLGIRVPGYDRGKVPNDIGNGNESVV